MKSVKVAMIGLVVAFTSATATATTSFSKCLELAPTGEQFSISLDMSVDTSHDPIVKSGNLGVSNDEGSEVSEEQERKFKPMVECLASLLDS